MVWKELGRIATGTVASRSLVAWQAAALAITITLSNPALAASFTVTNTSDSGPGSLRDAITQADAAGGTNTITLQPGLGTITLASNLPLVATSVTINGNGNTLDGASTYRGFLISGIAPDGVNAAATTVSISNLTIQNVNAQGGNGNSGGGGGLGAGGAVFVGPAANVTLSNVQLASTTAVGGSGLSTVIGNANYFRVTLAGTANS